MELLDRVKEQAKIRGITLQTLAENIDLSINSVYGWKKSCPSADKLKKVADYLGVSVDYLLGRDISNAKNLNHLEEKIINSFRKSTANMTNVEKEAYCNSLEKILSATKELFDCAKKQ